MTADKSTAGEWRHEFDFIEFVRQTAASSGRRDVTHGIGDDCAVLQPPSGEHLLVSSDTLNEGVHFFSSDTPESIGHKALAVNLSDLAACGASPLWACLNISLPRLDECWLRGFFTGFMRLARRHKVALIGGDTTHGALSISITVTGHSRRPLLRGTAQAGDLVAISGQIGSAAFALKHRHHPAGRALSRALQWPQPRLDIGQTIAPFASAAIDVSDGLAADLSHLCQASGLSACVDLHAIPVHPLVKRHAPNWPALVLAGGDDYQLLFTLAPSDKHKLPPDCHVIGHLQATANNSPPVRVLDNGRELMLQTAGYRHFQ